MPQNLTKILFLALMLICILVVNAQAIPISAYREKISQASIFVASLKNYDESLSDEENLAEQQNTIKTIRRILPPNEKIEIQNQTFEINNNWLLDKLTQFEEEKDYGKQLNILGEVSSRLNALQTKLSELEDAEKNTSFKDENRKKLQEILNRPEYQKPVPDKESWFERIINQLEEWFRKIFPESESSGETLPTGDFRGFGSGLQIIILIGVLGFIGFLLYRFAPALLKNFKIGKRDGKKDRVILGETILADETPQNLFSEAEELARRGELRAAIRKGYIALLCELSDRKIIGLARHKTNRDYLRDVRSREKLFQKMRGLTNEYERHWYGFDSVEKNDWEEFKKQYQLLINGER